MNEVAPIKTPSVSRQTARVHEILAKAAEIFNDFGGHGLKIEDIAKRLGITRATLYNYFADRDDLIQQCYLDTIGVYAEHLETADSEAQTGLDKVLRFVELSLSTDGRTLAVPSDVHLLAEPYKAAVEQANQSNDQKLEQFIKLGIADGTIRQCRSDIVCHAIAGIVEQRGIRYWLPSSGAPKDHPAYEKAHAASQAVLGFLRVGIGAPEFKDRMQFPIDAIPLSTASHNPFRQTVISDMKHEYIVKTASYLFNKFGVEGISFEEVAQEIGVSKAVLYNYVAHKNDLLVKCYERALDFYERYAEEAESVGRFGLEKCLMPLHLNIQAQMLDLSPLILISRIHGLEDTDQRAISERANRLLDHLNAMCEEGLQDGSILAKDYTVAILASTAAVNWLPRRADQQLASMPRVVAKEYVNLFAMGLQKR